MQRILFSILRQNLCCSPSSLFIFYFFPLLPWLGFSKVLSTHSSSWVWWSLWLPSPFWKPGPVRRKKIPQCTGWLTEVPPTDVHNSQGHRDLQIFPETEQNLGAQFSDDVNQHSSSGVKGTTVIFTSCRSGPEFILRHWLRLCSKLLLRALK